MGVDPSSIALYNQVLQVPMCEFVFAKCTTVGSGPAGPLQEELLSWKLANNPLYPDQNEANGPNTVDSSCADGDSGTYSDAESVQSITVESVVSGVLKKESLVKITAHVIIYDAADRVDFYLSDNPGLFATWDYIDTIDPFLEQPLGSGKNKAVSINTQLKGTLTQAVRVVMRWSSEDGASMPLECQTFLPGKGKYTDTDDLAFKVDMSSSGGMLGLAQLGPVDSVKPLPMPAQPDCSNLPPDRCASATEVCPNGCKST